MPGTAPGDRGAAVQVGVNSHLAEHLPLCINVQDAVAGKFVYISRAWEEMTGLPVEKWLDDPEVWVIHPKDRAYTQELAKEMDEGCRTSRHIRILHRDGSVHWIHGWLAPIADASGKLIRVIGISVDITAHKESEAQLRGANLKLEQRLRSQEVELSGLRQRLKRSCEELGRSRKEIEAGHTSYDR